MRIPYNHKNNHSISAKFIQVPFNLSASDYGSISTPAEESDGELVFKSPLIFATEDPMERQGAATSVKARMFFKNIT